MSYLYYLYYLLKIYPLLYYLFMLYRLFEYYSFTRKVYHILITSINKTIKKDKDVEEIYEMILETEPDKIVTLDETKYVTYYAGEEKTVLKHNWFADKEHND